MHKGFLALFVVALVITLTVGYPVEIQPEDYPGFVKVGEWRANVYLASNYATNQDDALIVCGNFVNGRLATVLSKEEFDSVANILPESINDYTTYWTAGRNIDGTWTWLTTGDAIEESVLFWGSSGAYPIDTPGHALAMRKYANLIPTTYTDSWGPTANKKFICEIASK